MSAPTCPPPTSGFIQCHMFGCNFCKYLKEKNMDPTKRGFTRAKNEDESYCTKYL
uniref:Uncharacterized protein n=1 Tax=Octopus bimaculoides TaxID=37653 RepID=A0A0L8GVM0_OCTBM